MTVEIYSTRFPFPGPSFMVFSSSPLGLGWAVGHGPSAEACLPLTVVEARFIPTSAYVVRPEPPPQGAEGIPSPEGAEAESSPEFRSSTDRGIVILHSDMSRASQLGLANGASTCALLIPPTVTRRRFWVLPSYFRHFERAPHCQLTVAPLDIGCQPPPGGLKALVGTPVA
jgi:hypothetical protein